MKHYIKDGEEVIEFTKEEADQLAKEGKLIRGRAANAEIALRMLISYHERMTMGRFPNGDYFLHALQYALELVEREKEKESAAVEL